MLHYIALTVDIWNTRPLEDEQAEQIDNLCDGIGKVNDEGVKLRKENHRLKAWICNECDAHESYCKGPKKVGCNLDRALAALPQKGQDNEQD